VLGNGVLRGDDEGGSTVADARGGARGDDAVLLKDGGELCQASHVGLGPGVLVCGKGDGLASGLDLDGSNLCVKDARLVCGAPAVLRGEGILVRVLAGDVVLLGQVLCSDPHGEPDVVVGQAGPQRVGHGRGCPQRGTNRTDPGSV